MIPPENTSSLRYMLEHRHQITAFCSNAFHCSHSAVLRLDMLVQRLGWTFDVVDGRSELRQRLICTHCTTRWPQLIFKTYISDPERWQQSSSRSVDTELSMDEIIERTRRFNEMVRKRDAEIGEVPTTGKYRRWFGR